MSRRKGRANKGNAKPPALLLPAKHHKHCACDRCVDDDVTNVEAALEKAWEKHNREVGIDIPRIRVTMKESPVIGPYEDRDTDNARFVMCPMTIVGYITPQSRRRK